MKKITIKSFLAISLLLTIACFLSYMMFTANSKHNVMTPTPTVVEHPKNVRMPDKASEHTMRVHPYKTLDIQQKYDIAYQQKLAFNEQQSSNNNLPWQSLGPSTVGGRTRTLIFDPVDHNIMYTAGISGGIWKSTNAGDNWLPIADHLSSTSVSTLALLPTNNKILFAGTGEGVYVGRAFVNSIGFAGNGIFVSKDAGKSWQSLTFTANNDDFTYTNKIRIGKNNRLHAVTNSGIWQSDDLGASWTQTLDKKNVLGGCLELEISPDEAEEDRLLASCGNFTQGGAVYLSTDSGKSWQPVIQAPFQGRTTVKFAPSNPKVVYALSANTQDAEIPHALNGFYQSTDAGLTWQRVVSPEGNNTLSRYLLSNPNSWNCDNPEQSTIYGQGWYDNALAVDPLNENIVWAGAVEIMRSTDGGQSWQQTAFYYGGDDHPHVDHHGLYFHPLYDGVSNKRLYSVNDGGIAFTDTPDGEGRALCDTNEATISWQPLNNQYNVTQFYHGDVSDDGTQIIGGTQDNNTLLLEPAMDWRAVLGGDGGYAFFISPTEYVASSQFGYLAYFDENEGRSLFGNTDRSLFITPYTVDPNNAHRVWLGGFSLWRMDDIKSDEFVRASEPFTDEFRNGITALTVEPNNSNRVTFAQSDRKLSRLTNALSSDGTTPTEDITFVEGAYIRHLSHSIHNSKRLYAVVSTFGMNHIWTSDNLGDSWSTIDGEGESGFPDLPAHTLVEMKESPEEIYVGTDFGVYVTKDKGNTWQPFVNELPNVAVYKLVRKRIDFKNKLYAFTYGRGVFSIELDTENTAPNWVAEPLSIVTEVNKQVSFELSELLSDINGDPFTVSSTSLPDGISLNEDGSLTGSFTSAAESHFVIEVSDGDKSRELTVTYRATTPPESEPTPTPTPTNNSDGGGSTGILLPLIIAMSLYRRKRARISRGPTPTLPS
jgi:photosystem II stability/assembly factor-like uncharacterized protein